jgi:hypothetical protein
MSWLRLGNSIGTGRMLRMGLMSLKTALCDFKWATLVSYNDL